MDLQFIKNTAKGFSYGMGARAASYFVFTSEPWSFLGLKRYVLGYDSETYFEDMALATFLLLAMQTTMLGIVVIERQKKQSQKSGVAYVPLKTDQATQFTPKIFENNEYVALKTNHATQFTPKIFENKEQDKAYVALKEELLDELRRIGKEKENKNK